MDITVTKSHRDFIIQDYNIIFPPLLQRLSQKCSTQETVSTNDYTMDFKGASKHKASTTK